ncbi:MAG: TonB family protein [Bacteroidia bacterium]|nr:TonB family protein [Bacteroidia bacterium]
MEAFTTYLLKSIVWLTGFAVIYLLFLRNERFFQLKRVYLIFGILVSLILPVISVHYLVDVPAPAVSNINLDQTEISASVKAAGPITTKSFDYRMILLLLYLSGVLFLGYRIIRHIILLRKAIGKAKINNRDSAKLVRISGFPASFSFFNYVFINPSVDEAEVEEIMNHELVHVNQKHWLDLLLAEMLRMFQWINPFVWIYTGFIRLNNEYLADRMALQRTSNPANYKATLVNQLFSTPVISLSNSFNYSLNKKRFDMMKKIITSPYRKLKVLLVLPVIAIILYAFATPEYSYIPSSESAINPLTIYETQPIIQKEVKGIVLNKEGKPLAGVVIMSSGTSGNARGTETGANGQFTITDVQDEASLMFYRRGYKPLTLKPDFASEMKVTMEVDPEYKAPLETSTNTPGIPTPPQELVVIDGVISENSYFEVMKELGYNLGPVKSLFGKEAIDKYGDKGINGVREITTRKKAIEMGQKVPLPRLAPADYPTFQGKRFTGFSDWICTQTKYPEAAKTRNIEGWVTVNFTVELDGSMSDIKSTLGDPLLVEEIKRVIYSAPKWDPPQNPEVDSPFNSSVTLEFKLPDRISRDEPFVVVEQMPMYPGGDVALLYFIENNTKYPEEAKAQKIEGRVIVRFIVNTEGYTEGISVIKGVHPLLDAEAVRVISIMPKFEPGMQGGKAVNVWYMAPVNFLLTKTDTPK